MRICILNYFWLISHVLKYYSYFYYSFRYKILMDFFSQSGCTQSISSQVRDDSKKKVLVLIYWAWGGLQVKASTFKLTWRQSCQDPWLLLSYKPRKRLTLLPASLCSCFFKPTLGPLIFPEQDTGALTPVFTELCLSCWAFSPVPDQLKLNLPCTASQHFSRWILLPKTFPAGVKPKCKAGPSWPRPGNSTACGLLTW